LVPFFCPRTRWARAISGVGRDSPHTFDHPDFTAPHWPL
jgi:hypothetical protein